MNKTEQIIEQSFNLVLIPTEAAQMKGSNITPEMVENAKKKYAEMLYGKLALKGYDKNGNPKKLEPEKKQEQNDLIEKKNYVPTLKPEPVYPMKKAGFADALILTVIVLVYAAIIINLILKLK